MHGKSRLVASTWVTSIVSLAAFACGTSAPVSSDDEAVSRAEQACQQSDDHICRSLTLTATRTYGAHPASHDGSVTLIPSMQFAVPQSIAVTTGSPGTGTATLTLKDGWRETRCTYRGDNAHGRYKLDRCDCSVGSNASADHLTLHIADGDHAQTTTATLKLDENGHCHAPDAGADAGHPDSSAPDSAIPDASHPDTAPACDPAQCDDGNPCTTDACGATGACTHAAADDGTACTDSNLCTQTDICLGGACVGVNPVTCDALDQCHVAGACDPSTGACSKPSAPDGTACSSGDLCVLTRSESCHAGVCGGGFLDCGGAECASTACDSTTGQCRPSPAGTPCTGGSCDGDYACVPYPAAKDVTFRAPICPPFTSECTAAGGTFHASSFGCDYAPLAAGTACSAGICDGNNACVPAGSPPSASSNPVTASATCPVAGACTNAGSIDFALGSCAYVDLPAGASCGAGTCDGHGSCSQ